MKTFPCPWPEAAPLGGARESEERKGARDKNVRPDGTSAGGQSQTADIQTALERAKQCTRQVLNKWSQQTLGDHLPVITKHCRKCTPVDSVDTVAVLMPYKPLERKANYIYHKYLVDRANANNLLMRT